MLFIVRKAIIACCLVQIYLSKRFIMSNPTQSESPQGDVLLHSLSIFTAVAMCVLLKSGQENIKFSECVVEEFCKAAQHELGTE